MKKLFPNILVIISFCCIAISIASMFTTIVGYTDPNGVYHSYSLMDFWGNSDFDKYVSNQYNGNVYIDLDIEYIRIFAVIGILAVLCAIIGLVILSKQKLNVFSFILTLLGLLGTMAPAVLIFICVFLLGDEFDGTITCGIYPYVSIVAMIISIIASTYMFRRNSEYHKKLRKAQGLIFRGGNL